MSAIKENQGFSLSCGIQTRWVSYHGVCNCQIKFPELYE